MSMSHILLRPKRRKAWWWLSGGISASACLAAYKAKGAASLAASCKPVGGSLGDLTTGAAPTWNASDGWIFDGSTYLAVPSITANPNLSILIRASGITFDGVRGFFGYYNGDVDEIWLRLGADRYYCGYMGDAAMADYCDVSGVYALTKEHAYSNGVIKASPAGSPTAFSAAHSFYIGGVNNGGSLVFAMAGNVQAFALYNATLTEAQIAAVSTAMNAL